jgi:hypothetical protein
MLSSTFLFTGVTLGLASCAWGVGVLVRRSRQSKDTDVTATSVRVD